MVVRSGSQFKMKVLGHDFDGGVVHLGLHLEEIVDGGLASPFPLIEIPDTKHIT
jgi:hypothetical protein